MGNTMRGFNERISEPEDIFFLSLNINLKHLVIFSMAW